MTLVMTQDPVFQYNNNNSKEDNFQKWWRWNRREKDIHNEVQYNEEKAREVFELYFENLGRNIE